MANEEDLNNLTEMILNGNLNDAIYDQAKKQASNTLQEREKRKKESAEQHRLYTIEREKPGHRYIQLSNDKHVYGKERLEYCKNYDLPPLEIFLSELVQGKHRAEFKNNSTADEATTYLSLQINARINAANPTLEKDRSLKTIIAEERTKIDADKLQLKAKMDKTEDMCSDLKKELQKIVKPNSNGKTKLYTT